MNSSNKISLNILAGIVPAALTEYSIVNERVARVIIATTSNPNVNAVREMLASSLGNAVTPIRNSFRWLDNTRSSMIGYVTLATPQRLLEDTDPTKSGYRLVAANMYMDPKDETVWEMKKASVGSYMVRQGHDDLSELLETARTSPRGGIPRMASVIAASAQPREVVAFVNSLGFGIPSVDYGFVIDRSEAGVRVLAENYTKPIPLRNQEVVASYGISDAALAQAIQAGIDRTGKRVTASKADMVEYYRKAYSYAPDYLKKVIQEIEDLSAM